MNVKIGNYLLRRKLKKRSRKQEFLGMKKSHKIGILFDATEYDNYMTIRKLVKDLKKEGKQVKVLGYSNSKHHDEKYLGDEDNGFITKKDFNWLAQTKDEFTLKFISADFDMLLVISDTLWFPIKYIGLLSNAHFKVSRNYSSGENFDFMIEFPGEKTTFNEQISQIIRYLNMLTNSEKHEPSYI